MASSKDTYESHTWRANTFAAGAWRGVGVAEAPLVGPGLEARAASDLLHARAANDRLHARTSDDRLHAMVESD